MSMTSKYNAALNHAIEAARADARTFFVVYDRDVDDSDFFATDNFGLNNKFIGAGIIATITIVNHNTVRVTKGDAR